MTYRTRLSRRRSASARPIPLKIIGERAKSHGVVLRETEQCVAPITQHAAHIARRVIVVETKIRRRPTRLTFGQTVEVGVLGASKPVLAFPLPVVLAQAESVDASFAADHHTVQESTTVLSAWTNYGRAHCCRLGRLRYRLSAATITADAVVPSAAALSRAASHTSSGTRTLRSVVPFDMSGRLDGGRSTAGQRRMRYADEIVHGGGVVGLAVAGSVAIHTGLEAVAGLAVAGDDRGPHGVSLVGVGTPSHGVGTPVKEWVA